MALDNNTKETLIASYTGADMLPTTRALDIGTTFMPVDDPSGGYENLTAVQDEILLIRQFDFTDITTVDHDARPITAEEAWEIWTLPNETSSGSVMYTISDTGIVTFTAATGWKWNRKNLTGGGTTEHVLPDIKDSDKIYILRKTPSAIKSINFSPGSRLTAASLNVATDQSFRLAQENYALWHNFGTLNPSVGTAGGVCPLNAKGLIDEKFVDDRLFFTVNNQDGTGTYWDAKDMAISNVKDAIDTKDAVNKRYLEGVSNLTNYYTKTTSDSRYPVLTSDNKIPSSNIPDLAFSNYLGNAANLAGLPALKTDTSNIGDWATTTAGPSTYVVYKNDGGLESDWVLVQTPTDKVISVNGETGAVVITGDDIDGVFSESDVNTAIQNKVGSSITGTVEDWTTDNFVATGTTFNQMEVITTGGTTARDLDDHFADIINVKDFGAVGDGTTDDTYAIQAALNHTTNGKEGTIFFPRGTYKVTQGLNLNEGNHLDLNGSTIELSTNTAKGLFGTIVGSEEFSYTYDDEDEDHTNTAFKKGDLFFIDNHLHDKLEESSISSDEWHNYSLRIWTPDIKWYFDPNMDDGDQHRYIGEWNRIANKEQTSDDWAFELANPLRYAYTTEATPNVRLSLIKPTKNIHIRNGILKTESTTDKVLNGVGINKYADNVSIDNVTFEGFNQYSIFISASQNVRITNCTFKGRRVPDEMEYRVSYGIAIRNGCAGVVIDNCNFEKIQRPLFGASDNSVDFSEARGPNTGIRFTNNRSEYVKEREAWNTDSGEIYAGLTDYPGISLYYSDEYTISNNSIVGGESFGVYGLGGSAVITNNRIINSGTEYPVGENDNPSANAVIQYWNATKHSDFSVNISDNIIDTTRSVRAIRVKSGEVTGASNGSGIDNGVIISNNTIRNVLYTNGTAIEVAGYPTLKINGLTCHGNIISGTHNGLLLEHINEAIVSSNRIVCDADSTIIADPDAGTTRTGILVRDLKDSIINSNVIIMNRAITDSVNRCISVRGGNDTQGVSITSNVLEGCGSTSIDQGLDLDSDYEIWVSGNRFSRLLTGINYSPDIQKIKVRTFGNFFSRNTADESVGDHGTHKDLDTGTVPQVRVYDNGVYEGSTEYMPSNVRIITAPIDVDMATLPDSITASYGGGSISLAAIGLNTFTDNEPGQPLDKILFTSASVHIPGNISGGGMKVIAQVSGGFGYMEDGNYDGSVYVEFATIDGSALADFNNGVFTIVCLFIVASDIDVVGDGTIS